jgi:hypothetical protein
MITSPLTINATRPLFDFSVPRTISLQGSPMLCLDAQLTCKIAPCDTRLFLWECNGHASQQWLFDTGSFKIQSAVDPTMCVDGGDMTAGYNVFLWSCNGEKQQAFGYDPSAGTIYFSQSTSNHTTRTSRWQSSRQLSYASLCLDSFSPAAGGNRIQVWQCLDNPQQAFNIFWGTNVRLYQHYTTCLDLMGADTTPGTAVQAWDCNGGCRARFDPASDVLRLRLTHCDSLLWQGW